MVSLALMSPLLRQHWLEKLNHFLGKTGGKDLLRHRCKNLLIYVLYIKHHIGLSFG
jgi:hypothetical protein